jgi:hypothetical protein
MNIHPDDPEKVMVATRYSIENHDYCNVLYRIYRADDGCVRQLRSEGRAYYDTLGRPLRMIGTTYDEMPYILEPPPMYTIENN